VLIHGAAGNVGAYAVQLARGAGLRTIATAAKDDAAFLRDLGAHEAIDYRTSRFEDSARDADAVIDLVGGDTQRRSFQVLRRGGKLISAVSDPDEDLAQKHGVRLLSRQSDNAAFDGDCRPHRRWKAPNTGVRSPAPRPSARGSSHAGRRAASSEREDCAFRGSADRALGSRQRGSSRRSLRSLGHARPDSESAGAPLRLCRKGERYDLGCRPGDTGKRC
jgi:hypothetical protein